MSRWDAFAKPELHMIHHALRIFCKYPGLLLNDYDQAKRLADEAWDYHCRQVERDSAKPS